MDRKQLIEKYIEFFESKGHKEIPNSSLIPENDPTVLFTTAGMHPLVPFLLGQKHPQGKRLCNVQKCIRTGDIEEVGDETHHTFFEMLGNWSLGDYWKKESIEYSFEFLTKILNIPKEKISVTCFKGDSDAKKDEESEKMWKSLGISKIKFLGKKDNWWGPAGNTGPCGPDTEIFINDIEIWNNVFMEYNCKFRSWVQEMNKEKISDDSIVFTKAEQKERIQQRKKDEIELVKAKQKNIDTGMGVERTIAILEGIKDNYLTDCFKPIIEKIEELSGKKYNGNEKEMRIIADHVKASTFIINDGIIPSNTEQGYVLRRLIRRAIRNLRKLEVPILEMDATCEIAKKVFEIYSDYKFDKNKILAELKDEEDKFQKTLEKGLKEFEKMSKDKVIDGKECFLLYQSYGFPMEMIREECQIKKIKFLEKDFEKELEKHQELSRTASAGKFKSGLADDTEATTKLHTATHLLLAAIKKVLNDNSISQKGSNITPERLRFDFSFPRKLTEEEIKEIEKEVNKNIKKGCEVKREEMTLDKAREKGATGIFESKYGEVVSVYTIKDCSKEICTGPHVTNTCELGKFKILKEESSSSGVRRIKAILE